MNSIISYYNILYVYLSFSQFQGHSRLAACLYFVSVTDDTLKNPRAHCDWYVPVVFQGDRPISRPFMTHSTITLVRILFAYPLERGNVRIFSASRRQVLRLVTAALI